jgi:hypothetical protein
MEDVKTFSTDEPVTMKLKNGTEVHDKAAAAPEAGAITTPGAGQPATITITDIDKINPPPIKWTGSVTVGAIVTRGNSDTENVNISANAVRRGIDDRWTLAGGYFFGRQKPNGAGATADVTTDNWNALAKYDYFVSKKLYEYALMKVEKDNIAHLDLRLSPGVGLGYQWVERADFNFNTEAGFSYIHEVYNVENVPGPGTHEDTNDHMAARFAYHLDKKLNAYATFFHNFEYIPSLQDIEDFNTVMDAGIRVPVYKALFSEFKVEWKYDSTPAAGTYRNDFRYIASLGFTF